MNWDLEYELDAASARVASILNHYMENDESLKAMEAIEYLVMKVFGNNWEVTIQQIR